MHLKRSLTLFDAILLTVGNVVGAGIFTTAGFIAGELTVPILFIGIWLVGGLLTLCGALTYAELSSMFPRSGGDYVYLKAAYGPKAAFLLGWVCFWIINPGSIAVLSIALIKYLNGLTEYYFSLNEKIGAIGIVIFLTLINYHGVRLGAITHNLLTLGGIFVLVVLIVGGLLSNNGDWQHFKGNEIDSISILKLFGPSMVAVIFSYSGWFVSGYVGDEIKKPERNLPLSIFIGTVIVTVLFTMINITYLYAIPITIMKGTINVGQIVGKKLFNPYFVYIIGIAIILVVAASINATILAGARIPYAMAEDGLLWKSIKSVHKKYSTPYLSLILQMITACIFVIVETFERLLNYVVFIMLVTSIATGLAHLLLRIKMPFIHRPYKTWGYPFIPIIFVSAYTWIAIQVFITNPWTSFVGIIIALAGIPFFYVLRKNTEIEVASD